MTPKRDPRSTPKRPQTDIKINLNFNAKTKRAYHGSVRRFWAGTPPREAPQEPWEGAQAARERPPGTHARGIRVYIIHYTVYSIHYTVYCVKYTVYRGIKSTLVYSMLVYRVLKYTVYWYNGKRVLVSGIWHAGHRPCEFFYTRKPKTIHLQ